MVGAASCFSHVRAYLLFPWSFLSWFRGRDLPEDLRPEIIFSERVFLTSTAITMSSILTDVGTFVTQAQVWIGNFVDTIVSHPLLLMFVIMSVVGFGVGLIRRLINLG